MDSKAFIKALWPLWASEIIISSLERALSSPEATDPIYFFLLFLVFMSYVVLPLIAGLLVVRAGAHIGLSVLGGASIYIANINIIFHIADTIILTGPIAFLKIIIIILATLITNLVPCALFGFLGGLVGKKLYPKET